MTTTLANFTSETQLTTSEVSMVSTTSSEKKFIGAFVLTNTAATNVEVTVWRVATTTTGTTGVGGNWIYRKTIPAGQSMRVDAVMGQSLGNTMKISALASAASVINIDISGTTET